MGINIGYIKKGNSLFSSKIDKSISIIIEKNLGLKDDETLLIVHDAKYTKLAERFSVVGKEYAKNVKKIKIPSLKHNGEEPNKNIANKFLKYDVLIFLTSKSLSHTLARRNATNKGIRIASMPGITETILRRSIDINYTELKENSKKLAKKLNTTNEVRVKTKIGTDITFSIKNRKAHGLSAGTYNKKGKWGNLPEGEVFIAPVEGTANGHFVADGSVAGFGKMDHPLIFIVENGIVTKILDGKNPPKIEAILNKVGKKARNIAEFGIGLNKKAKITGVVLEDEKAYGTCHLALGNNIGFGGKVNVPLHIDCVIRKPTIYFNDNTIMKKGRLIL